MTVRKCTIIHRRLLLARAPIFEGSLVHKQGQVRLRGGFEERMRRRARKEYDKHSSLPPPHTPRKKKRGDKRGDTHLSQRSERGLCSARSPRHHRHRRTRQKQGTPDVPSTWCEVRNVHEQVHILTFKRMGDSIRGHTHFHSQAGKRKVNMRKRVKW